MPCATARRTLRAVEMSPKLRLLVVVETLRPVAKPEVDSASAVSVSPAVIFSAGTLSSTPSISARIASLPAWSRAIADGSTAAPGAPSTSDGCDSAAPMANYCWTCLHRTFSDDFCVVSS